ncbi:MAG: thioredoxin domain-containing protein [Syntrophobacterales bacterium]|nr:MAG: thioredoxin domain-containing protein [Syntrophobacterales bacterium]
MKKTPIMLGIALVVIVSLLSVPSAIPADVGWTIREQLDLKAPALDISASPDGKLLYILSPGKVAVYSFVDDKIVNRISIDKAFDRMVYLPENNSLFVTSRSGTTFQIIQLERIYAFSTSGLPYNGSERAPVIIAVFSSYQSPYCAAVDPMLQQMLYKYPNQLKLVFKNFPPSNHQFAIKAATAALAAHAQGKFQEFHYKLFDNHRDLNDAKIQEIAEELELDMERFNGDMEDPSIQKLVARDIEDGRQIGLEGLSLPIIFVNGKLPLVGSLESIQDLIEAELKKEKR